MALVAWCTITLALAVGIAAIGETRWGGKVLDWITSKLEGQE